MQISERIYEHLAEKGMSQIEFANRTGISPIELLTGVDVNSQDETMDYMVINKDTGEFQLIETYRDLDGDARKRLEGYLAALKDMM